MWAILGTGTVGVLGDSATFEWFAAVLRSPEWRTSLVYSSSVAFIVSITGTIVLAGHFYVVRYSSRWFERFGYGLALTPAILPAVIYALALRMFGGTVGLPEQVLLGLGHLVFVLPMQYFVFESAQDTVPTEMLHAGSTLGAAHTVNLITVYLPSVLRAVRAAFLVGFFFSFDEIIAAAFLIDSAMVTVPKRLWDTVNRSMDPSPAVVATLLLLLYVVILALSRLITTRRSA